MTKSTVSVVAAAAVAVLIGLCGCQKQEGPMERAEKQADKAVDKAGQTVEKGGENIKDAVKGKK